MSFYNENKDNYFLKILDLNKIFNIEDNKKNNLKTTVLNNISFIKKNSLRHLMNDIINQ